MTIPDDDGIDRSLISEHGSQHTDVSWTTSHRMHEDNKLPCIFGCSNSDCCAADTIGHYMICPSLWQLAREVCPDEESPSFASRLCLVTPSRDKLTRLGIVFGIYHACKNDQVSISSAGPTSPSVVQSRAVGFAKLVVSILH